MCVWDLPLIQGIRISVGETLGDSSAELMFEKH